MSTQIPFQQQRDVADTLKNTVAREPFVDQYQFDTNLNGWRWSIDLKLKPDDLRELNTVSFLMDALQQLENLKEHESNLYTIFSELYTNALDHGVLDLDSDIKRNEDTFFDYFKERERRLVSLEKGYINIHLELRYQQQDGHTLNFQIKDSGKGFPIPDRLESNTKQRTYSGRGLRLLKTLCALSYNDSGTQATACYTWQ